MTMFSKSRSNSSALFYIAGSKTSLTYSRNRIKMSAMLGPFIQAQNIFIMWNSKKIPEINKYQEFDVVWRPDILMKV